VAIVEEVLVERRALAEKGRIQEHCSTKNTHTQTSLTLSALSRERGREMVYSSESLPLSKSLNQAVEERERERE